MKKGLDAEQEMGETKGGILLLGMMWIGVPGGAMSCEGSNWRSLEEIILMMDYRDRDNEMERFN